MPRLSDFKLMVPSTNIEVFCLQVYSLFFTGAAGALLQEVTARSWLLALDAGIAAIQRFVASNVLTGFET